MKNTLGTLIIAALLFGAAHAGAVAFSPVGPVMFKLTAITQGMPFQQVSGKTNQTATSTNITTTYKSTITKTPFGNADLLTLLANSFNTNFPAGAQIGMRISHLYVVDSTGTNILFDPGSVVSFQADEQFVPANETRVVTDNSSGSHESGNLSEVFTSSVTMHYDDSAKTTADGTQTKFDFKGFSTVTLSENLKTGFVTTVTQFQGTGGGPVRGVATILTGTVTGKASGVNPVF